MRAKAQLGKEAMKLTQFFVNIVANVIEKEEELFVCGRDTLVDWNAVVFLG